MMNTKSLIFLPINLLCLLAVISPSLAQEQEQEQEKEKTSKTIGYTGKGRIQINTNTNFNFSTGNINANARFYSVEPTISAGYFVVNNLMPQIGFFYSYAKVESLTANGGSGTPSFYEDMSWGIQFGLTYYFWKTFFLTANYDIDFDIESGSSNNAGFFESGLGYALFFNRNIALTPSIRFGLPGHNSSTPDGFEFQFNLGLSIYLTCAK